MSSGAEDMRRKCRSPPRRRKPERLETIARSCVCSNSNGARSVWPEAPATRMVDFIGLPGDGHLQPRLQAAKEVDHCGADLSSAFLLGPMSATRQHYRGPELGDKCRLLRDVLGENGGDKIALARHVQRGNGHGRSGERSHQLPAAIDVAPPGEGAMESAPRVFLDVYVDI